jgi:uncharacterized membrane protein (DUF485 family)
VLLTPNQIESITKSVTASVAGLGALVGLFQFLAARRSQSYQNYKTELELLGQSIANAEGDPDFKRFLVNIRKEKISFVAFGMPIPNSELQRVITYYGKGKATTQEIAKAWRYRHPTQEELSFELSKPVKWTLWMICFYVVFCLLLIFALGIVAVVSELSVKGFRTVAIGVGVLLLIVTLTIRANDGLFTAARLAKLEKERSKAA